MNKSDGTRFNEKIKAMLYVIDGTHAPSRTVINAYALALKDFSLEEITKAIDELVASMDSHITPAHIIKQIRGVTSKLSDSEMRSAAHKALSKPHWERMGFESESAYEKENHKRWLQDQQGEDH